MRYRTHIRTTAQLQRVQTTELFLDCGHRLLYEGGPDKAEEFLKANGGSIASNGWSRCQGCSKEHYFRVAQSLTHMNGG